MPTQGAAGSYTFGPFQLAVASRVLSRSGQPVSLAPKTFDLLLLLVENHGRVLTKAQLMSALWQETFVEEANLSFQISTLRKALGEEGAAWIETAPKVGYRFIGPVERPTVAAPEVSPAPVPAARRKSRQWIWIAAPVLVLALVFVAARWPAREITTPAAPPLRPIPLTSYDGTEREPTFSPDGSQVAFAWDGETQDNFDIYVKAVGSSPPLRLTKDPATDCMPAWSPDALQIAFHREGQGIYLVPPTGGPERKLLSQVSPCAQLSWSADGKHLSFSRPAERGEPGGVFLIGIDNGSVERLTLAEGAASAASASNPINNLHSAGSLSPDSQSLAFFACTPGSVDCSIMVLALDARLKPRGRAHAIGSTTGGVLSLAWADQGRALVYSSNPKQIVRRKVSVDAGVRPELLSFTGRGSGTPTISRAGNRMAYSRGTETLGSDIWELERNGALRRTSLSSTLSDLDPKFSPDGRRVAFTSDRTGNLEVWVANADGTGVGQLTYSKRFTASQRWSPDGRWIVYDTRQVQGNSFDVSVMDSAGGPTIAIVRHSAFDIAPSFSRDGKWIYFSSSRGGDQDIYRTPATGGDAVRLTENGGYVALESMDGKSIYYTKANIACGVPLFVRSLQGGPERRVVDSLCSRGFEVTGRGIYYVDQPGPDGRLIVRLLDPQSGKSAEVRKSSTPLYGREHRLTVSPDGNTILVSGRAHRTGADLYLVENFR